MNLNIGKDDVLYYMDYSSNNGDAMLHKYDLKKRSDQAVTDLSRYLLAAGGKDVVFKGRQLVGGGCG